MGEIKSSLKDGGKIYLGQCLEGVFHMFLQMISQTLEMDSNAGGKRKTRGKEKKQAVDCTSRKSTEVPHLHRVGRTGLYAN